MFLGPLGSAPLGDDVGNVAPSSVTGTGSGTIAFTGSGAGTVAVAGSLTAESIAQAVWGEVLEGGFTARELMQLMAAALAGKISGAGTPNVTIRAVGDAADRIVATVDANGNRLAVTTSV